MSTLYTGVAASGARSPAIQIQEPADTDAANVASVNTALTKIANYIAYLQAHAALFDDTNTFSAAQTIAALLTLSTSNVSLTAGALQSILKGGTGKLQVGTSQASDLELIVGNVVKLAILAAGGIDAKTQKIINVVDPAAAQDAATKNYVDGIQFAAPTIIGATLNGSWTGTVGYWKDRSGVVHLLGPAVWGAGTLIFTLPAGFRPAAIRNLAVAAWSGSAYAPNLIQIQSNGTVSVLGAGSAGYQYWLDVSFLGE